MSATRSPRRRWQASDIRGTGVTEYRSEFGSLWLDARELHHLAPLLGFVGDEFAEVGGRACKHSAPEVDKPCPNLGVGEAGVDLLIELVDDLDRRPGGCSDPEPSARLVAWHEITDRR